MILTYTNYMLHSYIHEQKFKNICLYHLSSVFHCVCILKVYVLIFCHFVSAFGFAKRTRTYLASYTDDDDVFFFYHVGLAPNWELNVQLHLMQFISYHHRFTVYSGVSLMCNSSFFTMISLHSVFDSIWFVLLFLFFVVVAGAVFALALFYFYFFYRFIWFLVWEDDWTANVKCALSSIE